MPINLDRLNFLKFDPEKMSSHIEEFITNCRTAWQVSENYSLPSYYIKANKFLILGMGGSGIAGDVVKDLLSDRNIVIYTSHDYEIPGWVDKDTIVIANSYSGDTEETVLAFMNAIKKGAKPVIITTGGKLKALAEKYQSPCFHFEYKSMPRAAFPYLFVLLLSVFVKLGHFEINQDSFEKALDAVENYQQKIKLTTLKGNNQAKLLAEKLVGKIPVVYSSGILQSVGRRFKSQFNENSKSFSFSEIIPELNHNALEGLTHPKKEIFVLLLESNFDNNRNTKRQNITSVILKNNKVSFERVKFVPCESKLAEILTMILFGDYISYYLAALNEVDPSSIKNINYLKSELAI